MITLARTLLWLLSKLPEAGPHTLATWLAGLWMRLSPSKRHVANVNIRLCYPYLGEAEREKLVRESFYHYVCTVLETGRNWYWSLTRLQALNDSAADESMLIDALRTGRGVAVLAPHFGAWEYLGMYLQKVEDIAILYKPPNHPQLEKALLDRRKRGGASLLPANASGLKKLYAHLRAGKGAGILPDQEPSAGQGHFVPFFGQPALTAVLAPRLIQKTGCLVFFAVSERLPGGRYHLHAFPADEEVYSADINVSLRAVNRGVERCIAINPAQYLWSYKRFRTQPEGHESVYS